MKITAPRAALLAACQIVSGAISTREVKPILRNLKCVADGSDGAGTLTLMATDLELGIRLEIGDVSVTSPGALLLPAARLVSILSESAGDELTIEGDGKDVTAIRGNDAEFKVPGEDPAAFPDIPMFAEENYTELTAGVLRDMIRRVVFATARAEDSRFGATIGVLWELEEDKATLVATDGRRLALMQGMCQNKGGHATVSAASGTSGKKVAKFIGSVVPVKAMALLARVIAAAGAGDPIHVRFTPNDFLVRAGLATIYSRLISGHFPNYRLVIPGTHKFRIPLASGPFCAAVRQAAIMTDDESVCVSFRFERGKLTLQANGTNSGQSVVEMPIEHESNGKPLEIRLNPKVVIDVLKTVGPEAAMTLDLIDNNGPVVFRDESGYVYVVASLSK